MITEFFEKGGFVMILLFLVALIAAYEIIRKGFYFWLLNRRYKQVKKNITHIFEAIQSGDMAKVNDYLKEDGPWESVTREGIDQLSKLSTDQLKTRLEMVYDAQYHALENRLSIILILGEIMPMLGLLGTVSGMIKVFKAIGVHGTSDANILAGGISEALLTTQVGLCLAIPTLFIYTQYTVQVERLSHFLRRTGARFIALSDKNN